jgi:hypothetical protein
MSVAVIVITHLWNTDFQHWFNFYFGGKQLPVPKNVWYERAVWGNVFALLPTAPIVVVTGFAAYLWHKSAVKDLEIEVERHKSHSKALDDLLGYLDPERDEGDLHASVKAISRSVDPDVPEGLTELLRKELHAHERL